MKLKYDFEIAKINDEIIAVAVGDGADEFHGMIKLNDTAKFIFENLKNDISPEALLKKCKSEYGGSDEKKIEETVNRFVNLLKEKNLLAL